MIEYISKNEVWVPISGFEGLYEVSNYGRVKSLGNGIRNSKKKILIPGKNKYGYLQIGLSKNGTRRYYLVHRLVAQSFLPNWFNEPEVNHLDENKENNHVDNLEWCSSKYNCNFGTRNKKISKQVIQFTKNGDFIKEYPSTHEVERQFGFFQTNISKCCLGKLKYAYGYIWKYKD